MAKAEITAYVDHGNWLVTLDTQETLRRATHAEQRESREEHTGTGAIRATVSVQTLRRHAPRLRQEMIDYRGWDW